MIFKSICLLLLFCHTAFSKLNRHEQEQVNELKERLRDLNLDNKPSFTDPKLLLYLQVYHFNINKAEQRLRSTVRWRTENKIDQILSWEPPEIIKKLIPFYITGYSYDGCPIIFVPAKPALDNIGDLLQKGYRKDLIKYAYQILELGNVMQKGLDQNNETAFQTIWLTDLKGVDPTFLFTRPYAMAFFAYGSAIYDLHFPLTKNTEYFLNAPHSVMKVAALGKAIFPNWVVLSKLRFYSKFSKTAKPEIFSRIPKEAIPVQLGGTFQVEPYY